MEAIEEEEEQEEKSEDPTSEDEHEVVSKNVNKIAKRKRKPGKLLRAKINTLKSGRIN